MYRHSFETPYPEDPIMDAVEEPTPDALDERSALELRLSSLNAQLRYSDVPQVRVCPCDPQNAQSLLDTLRALMSVNDRLRVDLKQMQSEANKERNARMQQAKEKQALSGEKETLMREKDVLSEKVKGLLRDQREKEDKWAKEREGFAKERRGWTQREEAFRGHTRALEDKARILQEKLRKTYQKGDKEKVQYKNATIEVYQPFPQRSMQQREYEHSINTSLQEHTRLVEQQSVAVREALKEVFDRLQKLAFTLDPELPLDRHNPQIIDLPSLPKGGNSYHDLLRRFLNVIEQRAAQLVAAPRLQDSDPAELLQTISRLKGLHSNWEQINESRKGAVTRLLKLASNKGQLQRFAKSVQLEEEEERDQEGANMEEYIKQRSDYFRREIGRFNRWTHSQDIQAEITRD